MKADKLRQSNIRTYLTGPGRLYGYFLFPDSPLQHQHMKDDLVLHQTVSYALRARHSKKVAPNPIRQILPFQENQCNHYATFRFRGA